MWADTTSLHSKPTWMEYFYLKHTQKNVPYLRHSPCIASEYGEHVNVARWWFCAFCWLAFHPVPTTLVHDDDACAKHMNELLCIVYKLPLIYTDAHTQKKTVPPWNPSTSMMTMIAKRNCWICARAHAMNKKKKEKGNRFNKNLGTYGIHICKHAVMPSML